MKTRIDEDIKKGVIFKRIVCDKCGKVYYGKCIDRCDDAGYSTYEDNGYDAYIIHPWHKGLHRKEMFLCRQCAEDIDAKIEKIFVKDGADNGRTD